MKELTEQQLLSLLEKNEQYFSIFFYTPFCGTCKLAQQMLEIIETSYPELRICKINIQFAPNLREQWRISSVPCLIRIHDSVASPIYAFHSIPDILEYVT
jgi:thiol-disulfide isomerase/thioredoxin